MAASAIVLLAFVLLVFGADRAVSQTPDPKAIGSARAPAGEARKAGWANARMTAAREMPLADVDPSAVREAYRRSGIVPGKQGDAPSRDPKPSGARYSGSVNATPLKWAGKLFYKSPKGDMVCSAQFIRDRILLTAAHCVRDSDTGQFYQNIAFALQYDHGRYSRVYPYRCAATFDGWVQGGAGKWMWDYAMILVDGGSPTGYFGYAWDWGQSYRNAVKIGYPGSIQNGQVIQIENGPVSVSDGIVELQHGNQADQGGSSGGAWIGDFSSSLKGNRVISVASFSYRNRPGVQYGPYFQNSFNDLLAFTARGCR